LRVAAGEGDKPKLIEDIQALIEENKNFIKSITDVDTPLDNLVETFRLLSVNIAALDVDDKRLTSPGYIQQIDNLQRAFTEGALSVDEYKDSIEKLNIKTDLENQVDIAIAAGDKFGKFYDDIRGKLVEVFMIGDEQLFTDTIEGEFKKFNETFGEDEDFFNKQRAFTSIIDGYTRAFEIAGDNISIKTEDQFKALFQTLKDKLILEDIVKFDEILPFEGANEDQKQIEKYSISLERLKNGTALYNKEYENLLGLFEKGVRDGLTPDDVLKLSDEDITKAAKTQLDAFIKAVSQTAALEDGIRGVSFQYQQLNKELLKQSKNVDLLIGSIKANFDEITEGFDISRFKGDIDDIIDLLEQFGLDSTVITEMTEEDKAKILKLFNDAAEEQQEKNLKEILQIWADGFPQLFAELSNFLISVSDRITENRIRNAEIARDAEIGAIDEVEEAYNQQQQNLTNAEKARLAKQKEFENQRDVIRKKSAKEIAELEMKNAMLQWELRLGEAITTTSLNVIKALGQPPFPGTNVAAATLAGTLGGLQVASLLAQMPKLSDFQSFSTGGMVSGPGTTTSDSIPAYLSNGESVINAKSTQMFLPQLDMINKMGGGSPLISGYNKGGMVQGSTTVVDTTGMEEIMMNMNNRPVKAFVVSQDMTNAQHNDNIIRNRTTF
jgi:hypothetical protein